MRTPKRRFDAEEYHQKYIAKQSGSGGRGFFGF
jgi:peptide methionine sulfoxide reductase MsrA